MIQANILIVDDSRENLQLLRDLLTEYGYLVRPVSSGPAAISAAQFKVPDVMLLDIMHNSATRSLLIYMMTKSAPVKRRLFESQFFGHRKGAFTGADAHYDGYFEQAKLLRVLEDQIYMPVGSKRSRSADVRIIAAANKNLRLLVNQGKVRSDFFHRLHVLAIDLPPLRERKEDIPLVAAYFFRRQSDADAPLPTAPLPANVLNRFYAYEWPGNVRELFNELCRYITTGQVELSGAFPADATGQLAGTEIPDDLSLTAAIERFEHYYIPRTLQRHGGHKGNTADILGIDRKTLYRKLKKYGLLS